MIFEKIMTKELLRDLSRSISPFSSVLAGQGMCDTRLGAYVLVPAEGSTSVSLLKQNKRKKRKTRGPVIIAVNLILPHYNYIAP